MRRIADDPDSWGKPADLERKPIAADDSKCPSCGVQWMHHMADLCPTLPWKEPISGIAEQRRALEELTASQSSQIAPQGHEGYGDI